MSVNGKLLSLALSSCFAVTFMACGGGGGGGDGREVDVDCSRAEDFVFGEVEYPFLVGLYTQNWIFQSDTESTVDDLSRYDMIMNQDVPKDKLCDSRKENPEQIALMTSEAEGVFVHDGLDIKSELFNAIGFDEDNFLLYRANGERIKWWGDWISFYNFANGNAVDWLAEYVISEWEEENGSGFKYDGLYFDGMHYEIYEFIGAEVLEQCTWGASVTSLPTSHGSAPASLVACMPSVKSRTRCRPIQMV